MAVSIPGIQIVPAERSRVAEVDFDNLPFGTIFSDHMLLADYQDGKWCDPQIVPYGPMSMLPSLTALHYGQSIFEGLKAHRTASGRIALFRPRDNCLRLNRSAARLAMPNLPESLFLDGVAELVRRDQKWVPKPEQGSLYVRPVYFATDAALVVRPASTYRFVVFTCPVGPYFAEPIHLIVEERYVRAFPGGTGDIKAAGNYAGSLLAARESQELGFHNVLWLDGRERRFVEESGLMNIFFVIEGVVITPPLSGTILPGVIRSSVLTLLLAMGIEVDERPIAIDEIVAADQSGRLDEAFGVGTAATVAQVEQIRYRNRDVRLSIGPHASVAVNVRARLDAIRTGLQPDTHGWLMHL